MHGLERPEATQEEWRLQLGLTEADHLRSVVFQEFVDDHLFGLLVQTSGTPSIKISLSRDLV